MLTMWGIAPTLTRSTGTHILAFSAPPRSIIYKFTNTKTTSNQLFSGTLFTQMHSYTINSYFTKQWDPLDIPCPRSWKNLHTKTHTQIRQSFLNIKRHHIRSRSKKLEKMSNGEIVLILFRWNLFNH